MAALRPLAIAAGIAAACVAGAYPEGAPWGTANPLAAESCVSCHFDAEPVQQSDALRLSGLPQHIEPSVEYTLKLVFDDPNFVTAGFQALALSAGEASGEFLTTTDDVEAVGAAIRSVAPNHDDAAAWSFVWRAPRSVTSDVVFLTAATAGNDDGSPLGDRVHFHTYRLKSRTD